MSVWRQKAIACLPEMKKHLESGDTTIYMVFFELLPAIVEAHRQNNVERLNSIYSYAEWCFTQKETDLWNAAAVAFYEHLGDYPETLRSISSWVKPAIYREIREFLEARVDEKELEAIDKQYHTGY